MLRPGEALQAAREAPGAAQAISGPLDVAQALAWRDFMVSDYDDSAQARWLADHGIDLLRGEGRITGPGTVAVGDATLASIRAGVPLEVMNDTIQPFPTFSEIYVEALKELRKAIG